MLPALIGLALLILALTLGHLFLQRSSSNTLAPHGGGCLQLQQFCDVLAELNANKSGVSSAKRLKSLLGELRKFLESETESKTNEKKNIIVQKEDASKRLEAEKIKLTDCERKEKDALKNLEDAQSRKESTERDKREAERDLDKKRDKVKVMRRIAAGTTIIGGVATAVSLGFGAIPAIAASSASLAASSAMLITVADAKKKVKNAIKYYDDAVSGYNSASSRHSEAERRKNEAQSRVRQSKDIKDKLVQKERLLQAQLDRLTDFLQWLKRANPEVNRTWKKSKILDSILRRNSNLPVEHRETGTVVSLCKEILAQFQILSEMKVLAIDGGNLQSASLSFDRLQTNASQLKVQNNQATDVLADFT